MFYKRQEHALRHGFWFIGNSLGVMIAGLLSFGIAHIKSGIGAWKVRCADSNFDWFRLLTTKQWLFVTLAVITFAWAAVMFWVLPDTPATAKFLSTDQRIHAVERLRSNQMVVKNNQFQWYQFREALLDPRILLICLFLICVSICSSSIAAVLLLLLRTQIPEHALTKHPVLSNRSCGARLQCLPSEPLSHRARWYSWLLRHHCDLCLLAL